jgi:hypothetical protein
MPAVGRERRFRILVPCVAILLVYLLIEGACEAGLRLLRRTHGLRYDPNISELSTQQKAALGRFLETGGRAQRVRQDPVLGWVEVAEANSAGMRDTREYQRVPAPGVLRIAAFGDSFTFGSDVSVDESWASQLSRRAPSLEVLNYGVGAYGLDQAYLRYQRVGADYHPHVVFIGYMSENIARNVNVFRPFYTTYYRDVIFTKPRFAFHGEELVLLPNPIATLADHERLLRQDRTLLPELGRNDYHYRTHYNAGPVDVLPSVRVAKVFRSTLVTRLLDPIFRLDGMYEPRSEAYRVTVGIFEAFRRDVLANGALPIVVVFPATGDQWRSRRKKPRRYAPLLSDLRQRGFRVIDLLEALEPHESRLTVRDLTRHWGHFSPIGNQIIAAHLETQLRSLKLLDPQAVQGAIETDRRSILSSAPTRPRPR